MSFLFARCEGNAPAYFITAGELDDVTPHKDRLHAAFMYDGHWVLNWSNGVEFVNRELNTFSCLQQQANMTSSAGKSVNMEDFFKMVSQVRSLIEKISCQTEEVERRHNITLSASNPNKRDNRELELLNDEMRKNANLVRAKLKSMQENWPTKGNSQSASVIHRIQRNQHSHLTRWFAEVMRDQHKAQVSFREKCKAKIQRQLEIVDKVTTDEELEEMLQRDNLAIFISDIIPDARMSSQALTEIERRHQDIISLECSIKEMHEIFVDTAMLLEIQGELINNIEKNVTSAAEYVGESNEETKKAVTYKKNPYKVVSLPSFLKSFKKQTSVKSEDNEPPPELNHY